MMRWRQMGWTASWAILALLPRVAQAAAETQQTQTAETRIPPRLSDWLDSYGVSGLRNKEIDRLRERPWSRSRQLIRSSHAHVSLARLKTIVKKLNAGEPITVVVVGSTVSSDFGGCFHTSMDQLAQAGVQQPAIAYTQEKCVSAPDSKARLTTLNTCAGWAYMFMKFINATWPHKDHLMVNAGHPGASFQTFAGGTCLERLLPKRCDLVLVEHHNQHGKGENAKILEQLIWRLWGHFERRMPAFILLSTMRVVEAEEDIKCMAKTELCSTPACQNTFSHVLDSAWGTMHEDWFHMLTGYYALASVSLRNMWSSALRDGWPRQLQLSPGPAGVCEIFTQLLQDPLHPNFAGCVLLADILVDLLAQAEQAVVAETSGDDAQPGLQISTEASMPLKSVFRNGDSIYNMRCYGVMQGGRTHKELQSSMDILPESSGFQFVTLQQHGETRAFKPGWVAEAPGSKLLIRVDTHFNLPTNDTSVIVMVTYLASYEHMGRARLYCAQNCRCESDEVDAHKTGRRVSLLYLAELRVTQHTECVVGIEVLTDSSSGEHKFKVAQVVTKARTPVAATSGGTLIP